MKTNVNVSYILALAACATFGGEASAEPITDTSGAVYFLTPNTQVTRFEAYDKPLMLRAMDAYAPNLELTVLSADNDPAKQLSQAESAVAAGAVAIILAAAVPNQSQSIVEVAQSAGIPVIAYAYNSDNSDVDYYVTVPFAPVGTAVANYVLASLSGVEKPLRIALITGDPSYFYDQEVDRAHMEVFGPLEEAGEVEIVCRNDNLQLSAENARIAVEGCLQQADGDIDAVLVHNDSSALGAIAALDAQGLLGDVKVYGGYDSQAGVVQHLLAGNIENTMVPPYEAMATTAVQLIAHILAGTGGEDTLVNGVYSNGMKEVPTVYNQNVFITRDNVQSELIDKGILSREDVCAGPALETEFCS